MPLGELPTPAAPVKLDLRTRSVELRFGVQVWSSAFRLPSSRTSHTPLCRLKPELHARFRFGVQPSGCPQVGLFTRPLVRPQSPVFFRLPAEQAQLPNELGYFQTLCAG